VHGDQTEDSNALAFCPNANSSQSTLSGVGSSRVATCTAPVTGDTGRMDATENTIAPVMTPTSAIDAAHAMSHPRGIGRAAWRRRLRSAGSVRARRVRTPSPTPGSCAVRVRNDRLRVRDDRLRLRLEGINRASASGSSWMSAPGP
jgi:hypothetical protein